LEFIVGSYDAGPIISYLSGIGPAARNSHYIVCHFTCQYRMDFFV